MPRFLERLAISAYFEFEEMRRTAHAGVIGADDFFALVSHLVFLEIHVFFDVLFEVEFDRDLVLSGWDDDLAFFDDAFTVYFQLVIECAARRLDNADTDTSFWGEFLRGFWCEVMLIDGIDCIVH